MTIITDEELLKVWTDMGQTPSSPDFPKFCRLARSLETQEQLKGEQQE